MPSDDKITEVLDELCLDDEPDTRKTIGKIINQAEVLICDALSTKAKPEDLRGNPIYERCVNTVTTQIYYERTLPNGFSNGVMALLNHLEGYVDDYSNDQS